MFRQQRFIYLPLVGTTLLCLLVGVCLAVWKRFSKPDPSARISKHSVETPPADALKYWTEEKMRNARPAPLPNVDAISRGKQKSQHPSNPSRPSDA